MSAGDLLIVHVGTGTILRVAECLLVDPAGFAQEDLARLSDDEYFDDGVICEIAERCGVAVDIHEQTLKLIAGAIAEHYNDTSDISDGELLDIVWELLDEAGLNVGGEDVPTNFMSDLRGDAARWQALESLYPDVWPLRLVRCASCVLAGIQWDIMVNPYAAAVVPWDVMGDSRPFVFVCDECAIGSAVVL